MLENSKCIKANPILVGVYVISPLLVGVGLWNIVPCTDYSADNKLPGCAGVQFLRFLLTGNHVLANRR